MVTFVHDPLGRRIAKKRNGTAVEKYLWQGRTKLLAVYDGSGALTARFEYAAGRLPVAMTKGSTRYFLVFDQVGYRDYAADVGRWTPGRCRSRFLANITAANRHNTRNHP